MIMLDWKYFILRPEIKNLPLMEQKRQFLAQQLEYERMITEASFIQQQMLAQSNSSAGGGKKPSTQSGPDPLLLDIAGATTDIVGGWSLRKLTSTYTGVPIRVRRAADSVEQDIPFNSDGYIDEDALTTFANGGTTQVAKWYDQSGEENHLFNSGTSQPYMTNSSGQPYKNGDFLYILEQSRTYLRLTNTLGFTNFGPRSVLALNYFPLISSSPIWRINKNAGVQIQLLYSNNSNNSYITFKNRTTAGINTDYASTRVADAASFNLISSILRPSPDETEIYHKGDKIISTSAIPNFDYFFDFNTPEGGSSANASDPTEIIIYSTDQLANVRVAMENNINTYYSL
jgi:hypothetical protein